MGDIFEILTFGSREGEFATINGLDLSGGLTLTPIYTATALNLAAVPEPGSLLLLAPGLVGLAARRRRTRIRAGVVRRSGTFEAVDYVL